MMLRAAIVLWLLSIVWSAHAQIESPLDRESRSELIEKGRKLLLDDVLESNLSGVRELMNYLLTLENEHYVALYPAERWLLHYWTGEYPEVLKGVRQYDASFRASLMRKVTPPRDYLFAKLVEQIGNDRTLILYQISESDVAPMEKDFLSLNLEFLIADNGSYGVSQNSLNADANAFISKYPESVYEGYIREHIRVEFKPSKWGFAFEFFSGYGVFTDDLAEHFKNNVPMGIAFDVYYKRWALFLRNYIGFSRTIHPINFGGVTWHEDAQTRVFVPEATLGYVIRDLERIKVTPFAGISSTSVSPTEYDLNKYPEYEDVGLDFTTTISYGINLDIKLGEPGTPIIAGHESANWFIRVRYSYNQPQFNRRYDGYGGNMHYVTVGFGGFGRRLKRDF